jgi:hypothetical protein
VAVREIVLYGGNEVVLGTRSRDENGKWVHVPMVA